MGQARPPFGSQSYPPADAETVGTITRQKFGAHGRPSLDPWAPFTHTNYLGVKGFVRQVPLNFYFQTEGEAHNAEGYGARGSSG